MESTLRQAAQAGTDRLRINEIFLSLQGESTSAGLPTVFIRLTGCPLRCRYCDTEYAFRGGEYLDVGSIVERVAGYGVSHVTVTGGEPLAQSACLLLLRQLSDAGYLVSLETSGALDIRKVDTRVSRVVDLKTPGSGEMEKNLYENIQQLTSHDQVKFVICDRSDYVWARQQLDKYHLDSRCEVLFSPATGQQDATRLAEWILQDRLSVRFQIQLHKILWGDEPGR